MSMKVKMETGEIKDVDILKVTPENYIVPKGEEDAYHCMIEQKKFDSETGERLSRPRVQKFGQKFFESFGMTNLKSLGYTIVILHDPRKWIAENEAKIEEQKKQKAEAEAKAKAEAVEAERQAMKAEMKADLLEELKAAGMLVGKGRKGKKEAEAEVTEVAEVAETTED